MKLTAKLKSWAIKNTGVEADADDDSIKQAVADALFAGDLTGEKFAELSKTPEDESASQFKDAVVGLTKTVGELKDILMSDDSTGEGGEKGCGGKKPVKKGEDMEAEDDDMVDGEKKSAKTVAEKSADTDDVLADEKSEKPEGTKAVKTAASDLEKMVSSLSMPGMADAGGDGEKSLSVRVKAAAEQYSSTKSALVFPQTTLSGRAHPLAGRPVKDYSDPRAGGRQIDNPSELDQAVSGAFAKYLVSVAVKGSRTMGFASLPQHDRELLFFAMEKMPWGGTTNSFAADGGEENIKHRRLSPGEQKALIDDSTSGGLEAAPIVFDDMVIQTPLLNGELYPLVNTIPIDRGRRIEGVATGTVTGSWGGVDDTSISLFNTASYVTAFDTTIFRWEGAMTIGLDFMSDTPIDFAQHVTSQYGERLLEDLDDVIATGNGTTQPEGVTVKSGTTSVNFGGATTLGSYESLRFGVAKAEHKSSLLASAVFCGTETSYQRAKAIPVGASDARRLSNVGNMPSYADYSWMGVPYKINESLGNTKIFYAILARYRMYRRRGLTMRTSTEGSTLIRANEMLLVAMARYGGHLERGAVAAVTSTAPA